MTTMIIDNPNIYSNETATATTFLALIMDKNQSSITTTLESTSLDDLCKNFHVSLLFIINLNNYIHQS